MAPRLSSFSNSDIMWCGCLSPLGVLFVLYTLSLILSMSVHLVSILNRVENKWPYVCLLLSSSGQGWEWANSSVMRWPDWEVQGTCGMDTEGVQIQLQSSEHNIWKVGQPKVVNIMESAVIRQNVIRRNQQTSSTWKLFCVSLICKM